MVWDATDLRFGFPTGNWETNSHVREKKIGLVFRVVGFFMKGFLKGSPTEFVIKFSPWSETLQTWDLVSLLETERLVHIFEEKIFRAFLQVVEFFMKGFKRTLGGVATDNKSHVLMINCVLRGLRRYRLEIWFPNWKVSESLIFSRKEISDQFFK